MPLGLPHRLETAPRSDVTSNQHGNPSSWFLRLLGVGRYLWVSMSALRGAQVFPLGAEPRREAATRPEAQSVAADSEKRGLRRPSISRATRVSVCPHGARARRLVAFHVPARSSTRQECRVAAAIPQVVAQCSRRANWGSPTDGGRVEQDRLASCTHIETG